MIRVVLDTNVIVSALVFGGVPRSVLEMAAAGRCKLFYSEAIQAEVRRVLADKFGWGSATLRDVLPIVWGMGELVEPQAVVHAVPDDPDDNRIVECAMAAQASFIVSGDRHLLTLGKYKSISIVSPRHFIEYHFAE